MNKPEYLGDGLYASFDGYQVVLMANSPTAPTDMVYLDPGVLHAFQEYIKHLQDDEKTDA